MLRGASLSRRLLIGAGVFIAAALVIAAVVIGFVLHRFVQGQIDQRLDTQVVFLGSMLRAAPDGTLSLAGNADGPPFDRPRPRLVLAGDGTAQCFTLALFERR